jgi:predicted DNA-binding protein (MmcQ/YjbR family)
MGESPLQRLRAICLAFPEAEERETWGEQTFRVRDKIFAMGSDEGMTCKAPPGAQEMLIESNAARFYRPAYVGAKGWIGIRMGEVDDWDEVAFLVRQSYEMTAPKKLLRDRASQSPAGPE